MPHATQTQPVPQSQFTAGHNAGHMIEGRVLWFNPKKGYGFLSQPNGPDVFVHWKYVLTEARYKSLSEGQPVTFRITIGRNNRLQAEDVRPIPSTEAR